MSKIVIHGLIISLFFGTLSAQLNNEWHSFHGPYRNNKSTETGLLKDWPEKGPELLWTVSGLGKGYSSISIADGYIYTAGVIEKQTVVFAFDLNGKPVWKKFNGQSWETTRSYAMAYTGSRSTPTYNDNLVYHLNDIGRLAVFDHQTGKEIRTLDFLELFDAEIPEYGYTESIHISGDYLYCNPAGKKGFIACLNKKSGKIMWANKEVPGTVGFSSPIIAEFNGYRQIINLTSNAIFGADTKTGKLLWTVDFENKRSNNAADPIFHDGHVFASSGYGKGSILIKLISSGNEIIPEIVWNTTLMDNLHGGVIFHNGYLYGAGHESKELFCLDFNTGKEMWKTRGIGSLVYADNMFYFLGERGTMKLVKASPERYEEVSAFDVPEGGDGLFWAHPVVCGGRLYIRHADKLYAYDIRNN